MFKRVKVAVIRGSDALRSVEVALQILETQLAVAKKVEETCKLVEVGSEYVAGEYSDGAKMFRKRK